MNDLKISIIGASHWHCPLYVKGLKQLNCKILSVSDDSAAIREQYKKELGCPVFEDAKSLLAYEKPDFVFAFSPHNEMISLAELLIQHEIPFSLEKPVGLNYAEVKRIEEYAKEKNVYCAIPFVFRDSTFLEEFKNSHKPEDIIHISIKFIAGPPSRYLETSPWMLEKTKAGGGCMTNLGVHFIDTVLWITEAEKVDILGSSFHYTNGYDIEDYAVSLMKINNSTTFEIETGYAYPMDSENKRDNSWTIVTKKGYFTLGPGYHEYRKFDGTVEKVMTYTDTDVMYIPYVEKCLKESSKGISATSGLKEMSAVRKVLDDIIEYAHQ